MITGINFDTTAGADGIVLTAEQCDIPAVSAKIGGTQPTSIIPLMPVGLPVAGIISVGLTIHPNDYIAPVPVAPIEITVVPSAVIVAQGTGLDLKQAYEMLRQQMLSEGLPFLNEEELEREIVDRKGTRS
jgi:hypothetical protein